MANRNRISLILLILSVIDVALVLILGFDLPVKMDGILIWKVSFIALLDIFFVLFCVVLIKPRYKGGARDGSRAPSKTKAGRSATTPEHLD